MASQTFEFLDLSNVTEEECSTLLSILEISDQSCDSPVSDRKDEKFTEHEENIESTELIYSQDDSSSKTDTLAEPYFSDGTAEIEAVSEEPVVETEEYEVSEENISETQEASEEMYPVYMEQAEYPVEPQIASGNIPQVPPNPTAPVYMPTYPPVHPTEAMQNSLYVVPPHLQPTFFVENCQITLSPCGNQHPGNTIYPNPPPTGQPYSMYSPYMMNELSVPYHMKPPSDKPSYMHNKRHESNRGSFRGRGTGRRRRDDHERSNSISSDHSSYNDSSGKPHYKDNVGQYSPAIIPFHLMQSYPVTSLARSAQGVPLIRHSNHSLPNSYSTPPSFMPYANHPPPPPPPPPPVATQSMDLPVMSSDMPVPHVSVEQQSLSAQNNSLMTTCSTYIVNNTTMVVSSQSDTTCTDSMVEESCMQSSSEINQSLLMATSVTTNISNATSAGYVSSETDSHSDKSEAIKEYTEDNFESEVGTFNCGDNITTYERSYDSPGVALSVDPQNVSETEHMFINAEEIPSAVCTSTDNSESPVVDMSCLNPNVKTFVPPSSNSSFMCSKLNFINTDKNILEDLKENKEFSFCVDSEGIDLAFGESYNTIQKSDESAEVSSTSENLYTDMVQKSDEVSLVKQTGKSKSSTNKLVMDTRNLELNMKKSSKVDQTPKYAEIKSSNSINVAPSKISTKKSLSKSKSNSSSFEKATVSQSNLCKDLCPENMMMKDDNSSKTIVSQSLEISNVEKSKNNISSKLVNENKCYPQTNYIEERKLSISSTGEDGSKSDSVWGQKMCWSQLFKPSEDVHKRQIAYVSPFKESKDAEDVQNSLTSTSKASNALDSGDLEKTKIGVLLSKYKQDFHPVFLQPRGLINKNYWCYANAPLQALLSCPSFYHLIQTLSKEAGVNSRNLVTPFINGFVDFAQQFSSMAKVSKASRKEKDKNSTTKEPEVTTGYSFEPMSIYHMLMKNREDQFIEGRQQDAEEMLSCVLNGLHDEMVESMKLAEVKYSPKTNKRRKNQNFEEIEENNNNNDDDDEWKVQGPKKKSIITRTAHFHPSPISEIFWGQWRSIVQQGGNMRANLQPFNTLPLDIQSPKVDTLKDALSQLVKKEEISGMVSATTQVLLEDLPRVLILQLKRFIYDKDGGLQKVTKRLQFPIDLEITKDLLSVNSRGKFSPSQRKYKLFAIVNHEGQEATKGHYVSDIYHPGYGCWLRYDDCNVKPLNELAVLKHDPPRVPYLLFYRRCDMDQQHHSNGSKNKN